MKTGGHPQIENDGTNRDAGAYFQATSGNRNRIHSGLSFRAARWISSVTWMVRARSMCSPTNVRRPLIREGPDFGLPCMGASAKLGCT